MADLTLLLSAIQRGDPDAAEALLSQVYQELRQLARAKMAREQVGHTLQPTALVHEAWLRLGDQPFENRAHFFSAAAEAMRRILIESARRKQAARHGGDFERTELDSINAPATAPGKSDELLALDATTRVWDPSSLRDETATPLKMASDAVDERVWFKDTHSYRVTALPPVKPKAVLPKDADGWEDHLAALTPAEVEKTGHGWSLKDGELFSPDTQNAVLPLLGDFSGTSYRLRLKLRQLPALNVFHIVLPVADRMCGFYLETRPDGVICTGLGVVNGKAGKDMPGVVKGKQVKDTEPHDLEVTVRLDGANATITTTLDGKPLYEWTGPTIALSQSKPWATTEPGALALGTYSGGWAVSEVKVKRLEAGK